MPENQNQPTMQRMRAYYTAQLQAITQNPKRAFQLLNHRPDGPPPRFNLQDLRRLIVMDASFNPPTRAHVDMLRSACRSRSSERNNLGCLLLLSVKNADKGVEPAPFEDRLAMMQMMGDAMWKDEEMKVPVHVGITTEPYFHDKFEAIRASMEEQGGEDVKVTFLAGFDTLIRVFNPKYYPQGMRQALDPFFTRSELRITLRPDPQWGGIKEQKAWVEDLQSGGKLKEMGGREEWLNSVDVVEGGKEGEGVSSSKVRKMVAERSEPWEEMVASGVAGYVREEGLYGGGS